MLYWWHFWYQILQYNASTTSGCYIKINPDAPKGNSNHNSPAAFSFQCPGRLPSRTEIRKKQHPTRHFREERVQLNSNKTMLKFTENKEDLVCSWEGCFCVTVFGSSRSLDKTRVERSDGGIHGVKAKKQHKNGIKTDEVTCAHIPAVWNNPLNALWEFSLLTFEVFFVSAFLSEEYSRWMCWWNRSNDARRKKRLNTWRSRDQISSKVHITGEVSALQRRTRSLMSGGRRSSAGLFGWKVRIAVRRHHGDQALWGRRVDGVVCLGDGGDAFLHAARRQSRLSVVVPALLDGLA